MQTKRNYLALGIVLGVATGIASRKFVICVCIGVVAGIILNLLQARKKDGEV